MFSKFPRACKAGRNHFGLLFIALLILFTSTRVGAQDGAATGDRPNVLIAISDDQSFPHASAYGCEFVSTPAFDRVAKEGVLFRNAFAASPGCSPSRASLLTGLHCWQLEHAGTHASRFPAKFITYPEILEAQGYFVGYTGKGWGPGNWQVEGREQNPAGRAFQVEKLESSPPGISNNDYAGNFRSFLDSKAADQPFCFWYGAHEPHRGFAGITDGYDESQREEVDVPSFLPDCDLVRNDLLDYATEVEWFDRQLELMLELLDERGEAENTIVIVTSDNGMAFPRAKANLYEYGFHVPLAVRWPSRVPGERESDDLVSFVDLTATLLDACDADLSDLPYEPIGASLKSLLEGEGSGLIEPDRDAIFATRERHSSSRFHSLGYPQRAVRTHRYLLIHNMRPERWPAGAPQKLGRGSYPKSDEVTDVALGPMHGGYHDIDGCPTLSYMISMREESHVAALFAAATGMRPEYELFNIKTDPECLQNLAARDEYQATFEEMKSKLRDQLLETGDPRADGQGDVFETYRRYSGLRYFPTPRWAIDDPASIPEQTWWEERLPDARGDR